MSFSHGEAWMVSPSQEWESKGFKPIISGRTLLHLATDLMNINQRTQRATINLRLLDYFASV